MGAFSLVIENAVYVNPVHPVCPGHIIEQDILAKRPPGDQSQIRIRACKPWTYDYQVICLYCHAPLRFVDPTGELIDPLEGAARHDVCVPALEQKYQKLEVLFKAGKYTELALALGGEFEKAYNDRKYFALRRMLERASHNLEKDVEGDDLSDNEDGIKPCPGPSAAAGSAEASTSTSGGSGSSVSGPNSALPAPNGYPYPDFNFKEQPQASTVKQEPSEINVGEKPRDVNSEGPLVPLGSPVDPRMRLPPPGGYDVFGGYNVHTNGHTYPNNGLIHNAYFNNNAPNAVAGTSSRPMLPGKTSPKKSPNTPPNAVAGPSHRPMLAGTTAVLGPSRFRMYPINAEAGPSRTPLFPTATSPPSRFALAMQEAEEDGPFQYSSSPLSIVYTGPEVPPLNPGSGGSPSRFISGANADWDMPARPDSPASESSKSSSSSSSSYDPKAGKAPRRSLRKRR